MLRSGRREPEFVWATGVHLIDAMRHIAGDVSDLSASSQITGDGVTWHAADLSFASGARGQADIRPTAGVDEESYELMGDEWRAIARVLTSSGEPAIECWRHNRLVLSEHEDTPPIPPKPDEQPGAVRPH